MNIALRPDLEARLREQAEAEGLTVSAYVERLVLARQSAEKELEDVALQGLDSGEPIQPGAGYWEEKHRRLDQRLRQAPKGA